MSITNEQTAAIKTLRADGWTVKATLTSPDSTEDDQGQPVAVNDADGPVRVAVVRAGGIERRYDIAPMGKVVELGMAAAFGPHQNPDIKG